MFNSDSLRLRPRVPGSLPLGPTSGCGTKPVIAYVAGSLEKFPYVPERISDIAGLNAFSETWRLPAFGYCGFGIWPHFAVLGLRWFAPWSRRFPPSLLLASASDSRFSNSWIRVSCALHLSDFFAYLSQLGLLRKRRARECECNRRSGQISFEHVSSPLNTKQTATAISSCPNAVSQRGEPGAARRGND